MRINLFGFRGRRSSQIAMVPALALSMWGGGFACDGGPEQSPPVVVVQATAKGQMVRICPKCHRRFFGEQRSCTVDGSPLMDFHEEATPSPKEAAPPVVASSEEGGGLPKAAAAGSKVSPAPSSERSQPKALGAGSSGEEPVPVKVTSSPQKSWQPPPTAVKAASKPPPPTPTPRPLRSPAKVEPEPLFAAVVEAPPPAPKVAPVEVATPAPPTQTQPPPVAKAVEPPPVKVAALPPSADPGEVLEALFADESAAATLASKGQLDKAQIAALKSVGVGTEQRFTSSQSLLVMQYKATGDRKAYGEAVEALLKVPTNQYNPSIRLEEAEYHLALGRWNQAIDAATTAERYRQKFPRGDTYYTRLARTYEVLAKGYEGRFTSSEDPDDLDLSIRMWQRYLTHVEKKSDGARIKMAQENIAKLERIKERVL